jgi:hypothetical protein
MKTATRVAGAFSETVRLMSNLSLDKLAQEPPKQDSSTLYKKKSKIMTKIYNTKILMNIMQTFILPSRTRIDAFRFLEPLLTLKGMKKLQKKYPHPF